MTRIQWLIMAGECAKQLPDQAADWKYYGLDDSVVFVERNHQPYIGDVHGLKLLEPFVCQEPT